MFSQNQKKNVFNLEAGIQSKDTVANGREILLEVNSENFAAIGLYKKKGFINFAVRKRYYPDGNDAILMKKESKKND